MNYQKILMAAMLLVASDLSAAQMKMKMPAAPKVDFAQQSIRPHKVQLPQFELSPAWKEQINKTVLYGASACLGLYLGHLIMQHLQDAFIGQHGQWVLKSTVKFADVAGATQAKEELATVVDFLKNPKKYTSMGATLPRGVLLYGPPGNGKTLLAKAVAGEAGCSFIAMNGSAFVQMYVGVGAARARSLFAQARHRAPAIIFIDEIDSIGGKRTGHANNKEEENTLTQLLTEMDGFFSGEQHVFVIAATNRRDHMDEAFLRRFDRKIEVGLPTESERADILALHVRNKKIDQTVVFNQLAQRTERFCGSDLADLLNCAAVRAARRNKQAIGMAECVEVLEEMLKDKREDFLSQSSNHVQFSLAPFNRK